MLIFILILISNNVSSNYHQLRATAWPCRWIMICGIWSQVKCPPARPFFMETKIKVFFSAFFKVLDLSLPPSVQIPIPVVEAPLRRAVWMIVMRCHCVAYCKCNLSSCNFGFSSREVNISEDWSDCNVSQTGNHICANTLRQTVSILYQFSKGLIKMWNTH